MTQLSDARNYLDIAGIQQLKAKAGANPDDKAALKQAAEHFESIFINMMLQSMRKANAYFEDGNPMHSNTTKFFRDMYDQQLATDMASKGSLGLADLIVQQLSNDPSDYQNASTLRNDAGLERQIFGNSKPNSKSDTTAQQEWFGPIAENKTEPTSMAQQVHSLVDDVFAQAGLLTNAEQMTTAKQSTDRETDDGNEGMFSSPESFVTGIWDYAKKAAKQIGLNPAVMIAQSALETGWGKHIIQDQEGASSYNLFNVKAHRDWDGQQTSKSTLEFIEGTPIKKIEPFRMYQGFAESFSDFVDFLQGNQRYEQALERVDDSEQFLQGLQKAGYATDPNYADKIIGILKSEKFQSIISDLDDGKTSE